MLLFAYVLTGCPQEPSNNNPITPPEPVQHFLSGTFNGIQFVLNEIKPVSRSLSDDNLVELEGVIQSGENRCGLKGQYDKNSGNFSASGASANESFQINGSFSRGKPQAKGSHRKKDGNTWEVNQYDIAFDDNVTIEGEANTPYAVSLPEKWYGMRSYSTPFNAFAVEQWYTTWWGG